MEKDPNLIKVLNENGVVVMPTDTLYGIVGKALVKDVVERIYQTRKRSPEKPFIILIGDLSELDKFSVFLTMEQRDIIKEFWALEGAEDATKDRQNAATSIVLDCPEESLTYLHRGTYTLAFRLPAPAHFRELLLNTGPLIAPSANPEGLTPSKSIDEAREYFGNMIDLYIDGGIIERKASRIIKFNNDGSISVLRS